MLTKVLMTIMAKCAGFNIVEKCRKFFYRCENSKPNYRSRASPLHTFDNFSGNFTRPVLLESC